MFAIPLSPHLTAVISARWIVPVIVSFEDGVISVFMTRLMFLKPF